MRDTLIIALFTLLVGIAIGALSDPLIVALTGEPAVRSSHSHDHDAHDHKAEHDHGDLVEVGGATPPTLDFEVIADTVAGWNLWIKTTHFTFDPKSVNGPNVDGTGHAHVYVDGEKLARVYGPWIHLTGIPEGAETIMVTLNANDHSTLAVNGAPLAVVKPLTQ